MASLLEVHPPRLDARVLEWLALRRCPAAPCDPDDGQCQRWGFACTAGAMFCECGIWVLSVCISLME